MFLSPLPLEYVIFDSDQSEGNISNNEFVLFLWKIWVREM